MKKQPKAHRFHKKRWKTIGVNFNTWGKKNQKKKLNLEKKTGVYLKGDQTLRNKPGTIVNPQQK